MNKAIMAMTVASMAVVAGAATAADFRQGGPAPYYAAPAQGGLYNWAGPYAGINLGYNWGDVSNSGSKPSGIGGGLQGGYNWQRGALVFGGEADLNLSSAESTFAPYQFSNPWFGSLRGRIGYAMNNVLFYGTGGLAFGNVTGTIAGLSETKTQAGWTLGLGMEVGFTPNWSAKVEYLYMDLGSRNYIATGQNNGFDSNILRLGLNYHF